MSTSPDTDVFLARVTASGTVVGADSFGGADHQWARDVVLAPDGSRVIVGSFLGSMTVESDTVDSAGGTDAFVASVASDGTISWWRTVGGTEDDVYRAVAVDEAGNVYVAGEFAGSVDVAGSTLNAGSSPLKGLLVSYSPSGDARWAAKLGDDYSDRAMDVAWTPADEVLVAMDAGGDLAVVLATYASTGEELSLRGWADGIHRGGHGELRSLAFDGAGNLYVAGSFTGRLAFASDLVLEDDEPTLNFSDGFVVSFTPTGLPRWGRSVGGPGNDWVSGLAVDRSGDLVAITGAFEGAVDFGVDTVESAGSWDGFLLVMR